MAIDSAGFWWLSGSPGVTTARNLWGATERRGAIMAVTRSSRVAVVACLALVLAPSTAALSVTPSPIPIPDFILQLPRQADAIDDAATRVDELGQASAPDIFGGLVVEDNHSLIDVYLTASDPALQSAMQSLAPTGRLVFMSATRTLAELNALHESVSAAVPEIEEQGKLDVGMWFPVIQSDRERVRVVNGTNAQIEFVRNALGPSNVDVDAIDDSDLPRSSANRDNDATPRSGGDGVSEYAEDCSSAFPVLHNSVPGMLTASHCNVGAPVGVVFTNEIFYNAGGHDGSGDSLGAFSDRETGNQNGDAAVFNTQNYGGSSSSIWTGVIGSPVKKLVADSTTNPEGTYVYNEGAYSGETPPANIVNNNTCSDYVGFRTVCHLIYAEALGPSSVVNQAGDSGGPMVKFTSDGRVLAAGIASGHSSGVVACNYNPTTCWNNVYYVAMTWTLNGSGLGVTLKTG